jgi:hypothetical protein
VAAIQRLCRQPSPHPESVRSGSGKARMILASQIADFGFQISFLPAIADGIPPLRRSVLWGLA